jgi:hypothetical protein
MLSVAALEHTPCIFGLARLTDFRGFGFSLKKNGDKKRYEWLQLPSGEARRQEERGGLVGSVTRDVALWFLLCCIGAVQPAPAPLIASQRSTPAYHYLLPIVLTTSRLQHRIGERLSRQCGARRRGCPG